MGGMDHFSQEQRGTLYVTNLPKDVTEREVLPILSLFIYLFIYYTYSQNNKNQN